MVRCDNPCIRAMAYPVLGWIETMLEESYNERMHLLTFLKLAEPGWFMRLMVLGYASLHI